MRSSVIAPSWMSSCVASSLVRAAPRGACRAAALSVCVAAAAGALGSGCGSGPSSSAGPAAAQPAGEPIARVGNTVLTVEEIQKRIDAQSPFVRARYTDDEKKKEFLETQVRFEVLAAEAFARGLDKDPDVLEATKKIIVQRLTREVFDGRVKLQDVTDADIKAYFDAHQSDYQKPVMARVSVIALAAGPDPSQARKGADEVQRQAADKSKLDDRNWFKELAARHSADEATKRAGGDLRYVTAVEAEQKLGAAARQWLFASEAVNEVSPVLEGEVDGVTGKKALLVLKRTGWRKEITRNFDQVKNQIRNVVYREKRTASFNAFVDELKQKHGVEVELDRLAKVNVNAQLPPGSELDDGHGHGADPHGGLPMRGDGDGEPMRAPDGEEDDAAAPSPAPSSTSPSPPPSTPPSASPPASPSTKG